MFLDELRELVSLGDVFQRLPVADRTPTELRILDIDAVVLSHECQIAKPNSDFVLCAAIRPSDAVVAGTWGHIRSGRVRHALHFPGYGAIGEGFVDFRRTYRVHGDFIDAANQDGRRLASMTDEAREALAAVLFRFVIRHLPADTPDN